jgi:methyl-accepting chemotaxis protein
MKLTISQKLTALSLTVVALTAGSTWIAFRGETNLAKANERMNVNSQGLRNHMEGDMMHDALRADVLAATLDAESKGGKKEESLTTVKEHGEKFKNALALNSKLPLSPAIVDALSAIRPLLDKYNESATKLVDASYSDPDLAKKMRPDFEAAFSELEDAQSKVSDLIVAENDKATAASFAASDQAKQSTLLVGFLVIAISLPLSIITGRRIAKRLKALNENANQVRSEGLAKLQDAMSRLAEGDLTARFEVSVDKIGDTSGDEIAELAGTFDAMSADIVTTMEAYEEARCGLANLIGSVSKTIDALGNSSKSLSDSTAASRQSVNYIAAGSEQLAQSATEGANVTARLSQSAEAVSASADRQLLSVRQAIATLQEAQSALDVAVNAANRVSEAADQGGRNVSQTEESIKKIENQSRTSSKKVEELDKQGETIGSIVVTIEAIAEQTNLLALNAAIEAARAGEHGASFAVVADQVRALAEQSKLATKQIRELITTLRKTVGETVGAIETMNTEVQLGATQTAETGVALRGILTSVRSVAQEIQGAAAASTEAKTQIEALADHAEQSRQLATQLANGTQTVLDTVNSVATVSEEAAASVREMTVSAETISASADGLAILAHDLTESASHFTVEVLERPRLRLAS